ncbi:MAG: NUDIX domain-containing protein, partial [Patescibacteria group bacterium]
MNNKKKDRIFVEGNVVKHESAGGFLFFNDQKDGLMVAIIKKIDDTFYMPKGHIKEGETPEQAATREIMEELS